MLNSMNEILKDLNLDASGAQVVRTGIWTTVGTLRPSAFGMELKDRKGVITKYDGDITRAKLLRLMTSAEAQADTIRYQIKNVVRRVAKLSASPKIKYKIVGERVIIELESGEFWRINFHTYNVTTLIFDEWIIQDAYASIKCDIDLIRGTLIQCNLM